MFRSLSLFRSVSRPVSNSIYARGRRKLRTTCKFNTHVNISSLFITFQVRPQGTRRKEGRKAGCRKKKEEEEAIVPRRTRPFSVGYFGKAGYLSCKRTANPLCHFEGLSGRRRPTPPAAPAECSRCARRRTACAGLESIPSFIRQRLRRRPRPHPRPAGLPSDPRGRVLCSIFVVESVVKNTFRRLCSVRGS